MVVLLIVVLVKVVVVARVIMLSLSFISQVTFVTLHPLHKNILQMYMVLVIINRNGKYNNKTEAKV